MSSTILRNAWYVENYTQQLPTYLEHGTLGSAGEGKVSLAPRTDLAEAAVVVLSLAGMPEPLPQLFFDVDRGSAAGALHVQGNDLETLLGRPATPLTTAIANAVAS